MKRIALLATTILLCLTASAQYKPTQKDLGKDCTTQNGKLGTWKNVTVREQVSNNNTNTNNSSSSYNTGISAGANAGTKSAGVNIGGSYNSSNSNGSTRSNSSTTTTTREYKDIQCVEDKNAKLPQQSPVRW